MQYKNTFAQFIVCCQTYYRYATVSLLSILRICHLYLYSISMSIAIVSVYRSLSFSIPMIGSVFVYLVYPDPTKTQPRYLTHIPTLDPTSSTKISPFQRESGTCY